MVLWDKECKNKFSEASGECQDVWAERAQQEVRDWERLQRMKRNSQNLRDQGKAATRSTKKTHQASSTLAKRTAIAPVPPKQSAATLQASSAKSGQKRVRILAKQQPEKMQQQHQPQQVLPQQNPQPSQQQGKQQGSPTKLVQGSGGVDEAVFLYPRMEALSRDLI